MIEQFNNINLNIQTTSTSSSSSSTTATTSTTNNNNNNHNLNSNNNRNINNNNRIKRNLSLTRKKLAKKIPLIKKEIENETLILELIELLIESIIDCNYLKVKTILDKHNKTYNLINIKWNNWSLLHYACSSFIKKYGCDEHLLIIKLLINDYNANINDKDEDGWTPLHLTSQLGLTQLISYLINNGADRNACTIENLRPIDLIDTDNITAISLLLLS
jgi:hypothetical protein